MTTAIQKKETKGTIRELLTGADFKRQVALALPRHLTPDRFIRIALTALNRTPKLAQCTQKSLFQCLLDLSSMGLEADGRRAHLIPYKDQCTLILDYKGIVELIMRSGEVSHIHADVVCENDEFEYDRGEVKKHSINFKQSRGNVYAVYAVVKLKNGSEKAEVMSREEIEAVRKRSRAANDGPWKTDWNEMAKKTVFRRLSKWLPLSPEIRDHVEKDDELPTISEEERFAASKPIFDETPMEDGVSPQDAKSEEPSTSQEEEETPLTFQEKLNLLLKQVDDELGFENWLKGQKVLSTAETIRGLSEKKAESVILKFPVLVTDFKKSQENLGE